MAAGRVDEFLKSNCRIHLQGEVNGIRCDIILA